MTFVNVDASPSVPLLPTHTNYPGSWTWQTAADEPITNPGAYYYGGGAPSWGLYGLGAVSDQDRESLKEQVAALENMASAPSGTFARVHFSGIADATRSALMESPFPSSGGVLGFFEKPSSAELVGRVNNAHSLFISGNPQEGEVSISPSAIDPSGAAREDSVWESFFSALPSEIKTQVREQSGSAPRNLLLIGGLLLAGVFIYNYVSAKGRRAGGR